MKPSREEERARFSLGRNHLMRGLAHNKPHTMIIRNKCAGPATSQKVAWRKYEMPNVFANILSETRSHPRHSEEQVFSMPNDTGAICLDRREQLSQMPSPSREQLSQMPPPSREQLSQMPSPSREQLFQMPSPSREQLFQMPSPSRASSQMQSLHIEERSAPSEVLCKTETVPQEITIGRESSPIAEAQLTKQIMLNKSVDSIPSAKAGKVPSDVKVVHLPSSKGTNGDTRVAGGYASCKVSQLMHECAERGIEVKRGSRKATIVRMLQDEDRKK
jgi:hypothetical protein